VNAKTRELNARQETAREDQEVDQGPEAEIEVTEKGQIAAIVIEVIEELIDEIVTEIVMSTPETSVMIDETIVANAQVVVTEVEASVEVAAGAEARIAIVDEDLLDPGLDPDPDQALKTEGHDLDLQGVAVETIAAIVIVAETDAIATNLQASPEAAVDATEETESAREAMSKGMTKLASKEMTSRKMVLGTAIKTIDLKEEIKAWTAETILITRTIKAIVEAPSQNKLQQIILKCNKTLPRLLSLRLRRMMARLKSDCSVYIAAQTCQTKLIV